MSEIIDLIEALGPGGAVTAFFLVIGAIYGAYNTFCKAREILEKYHQNRKKTEQRDEEINSRFQAIEDSQAEDHKQILSVKSDLEDVRELIKKIQQNQDKADVVQRKANRAQSRSAMMRLTNELLAKGYMTETESETLDDLVQVFMQSAGDGDTYIIPNIVSRALKLSILTADEINQKQKKNDDEG